MIVPVILSGGSGTRLWPLSRQNLPKQFLALAGAETLFQQTVKRAAAVPGATAPLVVASDDHRFLAGEQLQAIGVAPRAIVLEPLARNTAPAIALAALQVAERDPQALLLVLPADHRIGAPDRWVAAVQTARAEAEAGALVTLKGDDAAIGQSALTSVAMVLNELATNAFKYGAMRDTCGQLTITLVRQETHLLIDWCETGVPGLTGSEPAGFGTTLLDRTIHAQLSGKIQREWTSDGLDVHMTIPLASLE
jgi:hypothetical protein